jgi:Barrel-sandwich domain of CusB or HlyD membrane-fusion
VNHAPETGHITNKSVALGNYVQVGQALMALVPDQVWVTANYKETEIGEMRTGDPVDIYVDAYPGHVFHGQVQSFQAGSGAAFSLLPPENATGNYVKVVQRVPVKIVFDGDPHRALAARAGHVGRALRENQMNAIAEATGGGSRPTWRAAFHRGCSRRRSGWRRSWKCSTSRLSTCHCSMSPAAWRRHPTKLPGS